MLSATMEKLGAATLSTATLAPRGPPSSALQHGLDLLGQAEQPVGSPAAVHVHDHQPIDRLLHRFREDPQLAPDVLHQKVARRAPCLETAADRRNGGVVWQVPGVLVGA